MNQNNTKDHVTTDEIMEFLKDNMVTQKEFREFKKYVDGRFNNVDGRFNNVVTKSYLDDKLADLRGDLTVLMRKEDNKLRTLVEILHEKKTLSDEETRRVFVLEPFPETT